MSGVPARLRVGLLTYGVNRPLSGVTRVALELGRALQDDDRCDVTFLTPYRIGPFRGGRTARSWYLPACERLPALTVLGGPLIALAARRLRLDLVHDPVGVSPFTLGRWAGRFGRIVTIHDAIAFRYPEGYPRLNNLLHRHYIPATLPNVDAVITVSEAARGDLLAHLGLPGERVRVVASGVSDRFRPVPSEEARQVAARLGLDGPFILSVGARQARKNVPRLLEAFAALRARGIRHRLALAGPTLWSDPTLSATLARHGLGDAVVSLGYVDEQDLPALYSAADLFVLPSLLEGFGLPVLEAMACGTPVVCSNTSSLPEVAGDAALLVGPLDIGEIADAMARVLADAALAAELRRRGLERAARFSWQGTARATVAVYRDVASRTGPQAAWG